mgnify:CR=1 FL=1
MADDGEKVGMAAAVALAISRAGCALDLPEAFQLPLLPPAEPEGEGEAEGAARRGPGRPPGARNKRTEEYAGYLMSKYSDPREALAVIYSKNIMVLAAEFGLTAPTFDQLVELLRIQKSAAEALAPYVASKMPVAVQVASTGVVSLIIQAPGPGLHQPRSGLPTIEVVPDDEKHEESND